MNPSDCRRQLIALLTSQIERVEAANRYLRRIKQAVSANDLAALQELLQQPGFSLQEIESAEIERRHLLQASGFTPDGDGFERCLSWCEGGEALAELRADLTTQLTDLKRELQLNRLLVNKGQDRIRRSLGILTGIDTGAPAKTYDSAGHTTLPGGRRDIAIA